MPTELILGFSLFAWLAGYLLGISVGYTRGWVRCREAAMRETDALRCCCEVMARWWDQSRRESEARQRVLETIGEGRN